MLDQLINATEEKVSFLYHHKNMKRFNEFPERCSCYRPNNTSRNRLNRALVLDEWMTG